MLDIEEIRPRVPEPKRQVRGPHAAPCVICGEPVKDTRKSKGVHVHYGGGIIINDSEEAQANAECPNGDLGFQPVGPHCARLPVLKGYIIQ